MRAPRPAVLVLLCATVALAGCGNTSKLLDGTSAQELQASLSNVQQAAAEGRCEEATAAANEGLQRIEALPSSVDPALKRRLRKGFQEMKATIPEDCSETATTTQTTPETPTTTETTPETPTTTETTPETPTTTETTPETPTETTPSTTEPETPSDGSGSGGTGDGSGTSGGTPPAGVDGPAGTPRSALKELRESGRQTADEIRRALKEARKAAKDALR